MIPSLPFYNLPEVDPCFAGVFPVEAATLIPEGGILAVNAAGNVVPAGPTVTGFAIGRAETGIDNTLGAAGAVTVNVLRGVYALQLDATHPPGPTNVGQNVYMTAPDTVSTLSTITCLGGVLIGFDDLGNAIVDFRALGPKGEQGNAGPAGPAGPAGA